MNTHKFGFRCRECLNSSNWSLCDVVLYSGMGLIMVGLLITVVGLGIKGFHSLQLRPITVGCEVVVAIVRVLVIILPCMQMGKRWGGWGEFY